MTPQEAKKLSIEVWTYLAEHPEIWNKDKLPVKLYKQIENMRGQCPLCELYSYRVYKRRYKYSCRKQCPLYCCNRKQHAWNIWNNTMDASIVSKAALEIVDKLKAWEI